MKVMCQYCDYDPNLISHGQQYIVWEIYDHEKRQILSTLDMTRYEISDEQPIRIYLGTMIGLLGNSNKPDVNIH